MPLIPNKTRTAEYWQHIKVKAVHLQESRLHDQISDQYKRLTQVGCQVLHGLEKCREEQRKG